MFDNREKSAASMTMTTMKMKMALLTFPKSNFFQRSHFAESLSQNS